jgi:hypothetical protein
MIPSSIVSVIARSDSDPAALDGQIHFASLLAMDHEDESGS